MPIRKAVAMRVTALLACLALASLLSGAALAHHPGSHAFRMPDGRVRVEVAAVANDGCTKLGSVRAAAPPAVSAVPGTAAVTAELVRAGTGPCAMMVSAVKTEAVLDLPAGLGQIMLYILAPDGTLASTERVPIR
jgi:hypothetical protein